ncbi:glycosyltransferase family 4 protein [Halobaculum gomorrense]|uniref:Glycosyltransferase involved in cell wall bisynthesis n=1 Tax=Halobaculum gomorrense TaxID=43928 RepID=A0A1M5JA15_9EURY|nr:glycosyltransferase family 4 protein [Halobaculum gomorrense]SHG37215.1 Glycosyltransferase involved in cell wall bisynthesis [Halobaculum gomorrense]
MLVSVVSPDLSNNCLGRAYVLAQLIERNHDVEIVGPQFKDEIWEPIKDEYDYRGVTTKTRMYRFPFSIPDLLDQISGDVVYASKPRTTSYGLGLLATIGRDRPLILDIDDWESGFHHKNNKIKTYLKGAPLLINSNSYYYTRTFEAISGFADARTVSNRFLQDRFGGTLIPHAKDTDKLDPSRFDQSQVRKELDLPADDFLVMFSGTPRPHKGVDDLARAVAMIDRQDVRAVVVGAHESEYVDEIRRIGGESLIIRGMQPFDEIPRWVAAADVISIPQKDSPATWGQLPSKVFDAMAMAKPVIASDVNDLPVILEDCGRITESGNVEELRESIIDLYRDPKLREELGKKARQRCVEKYSYDALAPIMNDVLSSVY